MPRDNPHQAQTRLPSKFLISLLIAAPVLPASLSGEAAPPVAGTVVIGGREDRPTAFFGVGYHVFYLNHARQLTPEVEAVFHERWRDLNPSFARVTHYWDWDLEVASRQLQFMEETGTRVYLTTWDPEEVAGPGGFTAYGQKVAGLLDELVNKRGFGHIDWYCMTNELTLGEWGKMLEDLPLFERYHRAIHAALKERQVDVGLLASDASGAWNWHTIAWAAENMDDVTAAYGGHHYTRYDPGDRAFHSWFKEAISEIASVSHRLGKPFIIGEFGPQQHGKPRYGFEYWDGCTHFDTPKEPMAAIQAAEAVIAAVSGGADAIAYWTFADFPDDWREDAANKWGTFRWDETFSRRPVYFAMGLLSRFMRGPADVHAVGAPYLLRSVAIRDRDSGKYRLAIVNRRDEPVRIQVEVGDAAGQRSWDGYVFDPLQAQAYCGEASLLNPRNTLAVEDGRSAVIPPQSLVVLVEQ